MKATRWLAVVCVLALAGIMIGCEKDGDDGDPDATVDVTGTWPIIIDGRLTDTIVLTQTGNDVTGRNGRGDPITGTVSGNRLSAGVPSDSGGTLEFWADVEGNTMTGRVMESVEGTPFTATRR
jgi:hypothetical protein